MVAAQLTLSPTQQIQTLALNLSCLAFTSTRSKHGAVVTSLRSKLFARFRVGFGDFPCSILTVRAFDRVVPSGSFSRQHRSQLHTVFVTASFTDFVCFLAPPCPAAVLKVISCVPPLYLCTYFILCSRLADHEIHAGFHR